ncbi:MAG: MaoC family dehydratase [Rhodospirillales bacterium]|nr:MaoC family dehydratase [Rhodospirillales bacterium]
MHTRYLDDFKVGDRFESRSASLTEAQIMDFALTWDPQPFHIDKQAALKGAFGGIIASGFQTQALAFRLFYDLGLIAKSNIIGLGVDEARWPAPVRPDDALRNIVEVLEVKPSSSKPDRGVLKLGHTVVNQDDVTVMTFTTIKILKRHADG